MEKKAQAWGTDLMIGFVIFSIAIIFFYFYSVNYSNETGDIIEILSYEGNYIADSLLSLGYPENWTEVNVKRIGIIEEGKIDQQKLEKFYNLSVNDYNKTKALFNVKYDYYFSLQEPIIIDFNPVDGIGKSGVNSTTINAKNLLKITRFTIYQNKPTTAYIYIFEQ